MRSSEDVLRSLRRYVAVALGSQWEVRLSREEGAFARPFARVTQAGPMEYPAGGRFISDQLQPFAIFAYPPRGTRPDIALIQAQEVEDQLRTAFRVGVELGRPMRMPLFNYDAAPLGSDNQLDQPGVWFPTDYVRVNSLSTQPVADTADNTLWTVTCDVRLAWRRTAEPTSQGLPLTSTSVHPG